MLRSYFSECSRQSFNIAVVESCRVESRLSFDRGRGSRLIVRCCLLLLLLLRSVRDGKMDTNQQEQPDIRNVHCLSIIESEKSKREATTATTTNQHELLLLLPAAAFCVHHTPQSVTVVGDFSDCSVVVHYSLSPSQSRILL